jgi:hypothetical protein
VVAGLPVDPRLKIGNGIINDDALAGPEDRASEALVVEVPYFAAMNTQRCAATCVPGLHKALPTLVASAIRG